MDRPYAPDTPCGWQSDMPTVYGTPARVVRVNLEAFVRDASREHAQGVDMQVPASRDRTPQPVTTLAVALAREIGLAFCRDCVPRTKHHDLYRSGATMNSIAAALYDAGHAAAVYGLTLTRTRNRR